MQLLLTPDGKMAPLNRERLEMVEHLRSQNEDVVPLLCEYLTDPRLRVRIIAAKTLAETGDDRAVEPLCRAMETNTRRLPLWLARVIQALTFAGLGVLVCTLVVSITIGFLWLVTVDGTMVSLSTGLLLLISLAWAVYDSGRDRLRDFWEELMTGIGGKDELVRCAADALAAIAGRSQGASVRKSLPLLRRVCADRLIHSRGTREAAARASARIQMSTAALRRLPIACVERPISTSELPIAAGNVQTSHAG